MKQADQKNQAADHFVQRDISHAVVVIVQVEMVLAAEDPRHFGSVALVAEHVFADRPGRAESDGVAHIIVGRAHEISRVPFFDQLGDGTRGREWDVVGVRLNGEQHLALVRPAFRRTLEHHPSRGRRRGLLLGPRQPAERARCHEARAEIAP